MNDSELAIALEPFRRVPGAKDAEGAGLGLPLTKALVEANHADFSIKSRKDQGTLVEIAFPAPQRRSSGQPAPRRFRLLETGGAGRMITCTPRSDASFGGDAIGAAARVDGDAADEQAAHLGLELIGERLGHPRRKAGDRQALAARAGKSALADPLAPSPVREADAIFERVDRRFQRKPLDRVGVGAFVDIAAGPKISPRIADMRVDDDRRRRRLRRQRRPEAHPPVGRRDPLADHAGAAMEGDEVDRAAIGAQERILDAVEVDDVVGDEHVHPALQEIHAGFGSDAAVFGLHARRSWSAGPRRRSSRRCAGTETARAAW